MTRSDPWSSRLSLFTGKGGVGKSTVVAAVALEAARRGQAPLVVELGHRASMQAIFGVSEVAHAPKEVAPGVHATNVDLDRTLADYLARHVPIGALARRIARSPALRRFFEAAPAVVEVLTLWRLEQLLAEPGPEGPRWHPVLVDFDATGHAMMFLELPRVLEGLAPSGPLRAVVDSFASLLSDPERTRLHIVTLPGRLPVRETLELAARLRAEHAVPLGTLFVNRVPDDPLPAGAARLLGARRSVGRSIDPGLEADLELAVRALGRHAAMRAELDRLASVPLPRVELPELRSPLDRNSLAALGRAAGGGPA